MARMFGACLQGQAAAVSLCGLQVLCAQCAMMVYCCFAYHALLLGLKLQVFAWRLPPLCFSYQWPMNIMREDHQVDGKLWCRLGCNMQAAWQQHVSPPGLWSRQTCCTVPARGRQVSAAHWKPELQTAQHPAPCLPLRAPSLRRRCCSPSRPGPCAAWRGWPARPPSLRTHSLVTKGEDMSNQGIPWPPYAVAHLPAVFPRRCPC